MKVAVCYVFPQVLVRTYIPLARRFASTWKQFPGRDADLHVIANGTSPGERERSLFHGIPCTWHTHSNMGWDIGAFQMAAESVPCDLLVCLGSPVHFHIPGWLDRMVESYVHNGPALYGCWAYLAPNWHVRTTCFWCPPQLLQSYPVMVGSSRQDRYEFEHGNSSFTRHVLKAGYPAIMVTTQGCFPFDQWQNHAPGPNESLVLDQHIHM